MTGSRGSPVPSSALVGLASILAAVAGDPASAQDVLANGGFEAGAANWGLSQQEGAQASVTEPARLTLRVLLLAAAFIFIGAYWGTQSSLITYAGNIAEATRLAARRLRGSSLTPITQVVNGPPDLSRRIAAALLFPISDADAVQLAHAVIRRESVEATV